MLLSCIVYRVYVQLYANAGKLWTRNIEITEGMLCCDEIQIIKPRILKSLTYDRTDSAAAKDTKQKVPAPAVESLITLRINLCSSLSTLQSVL